MSKSNDHNSWSKRRWLELTLQSGMAVSHPEAKRLEKLLEEDSSDATAHWLLLGYYTTYAGEKRQQTEEFLKHLTWLIENHPDHSDHSFTRYIPSDRVVNSWRLAVDSHPNDENVLLNAAQYLVIVDPEFAAELRTRAQTLRTEGESS